MNELEMKHLDSAAAEVFDLMLGKTCLPVIARADFADGLTVTIHLSGTMNGSCSLSLSQTAAREAMQSMLKGCNGECDSMIEDTARELCNVIVGSWKSSLPPPLAAARLSFPIATYDENLAGRKKRLYSFDGNLLALALSIRES